MSENANQATSRQGSENSGNGSHNEQGGGRSRSGNRNNRRRRPSQQSGGDQAAKSTQRPANPSIAGQQNPQGQQGRPQNQQTRQDAGQQRRGSRPPRPGQNVPSGAQGHGPSGAQQSAGRTSEKPAQITERQVAPKPEHGEGQTIITRKGVPNPQQKGERREPRTWGRNIRTEETYEDVRRENERIEKEIWLDIASIHTFKLD